VRRRETSPRESLFFPIYIYIRGGGWCPATGDAHHCETVKVKRGKGDKNRYSREYRPWKKVVVDLVVKKVALANLYYV